MRRILHTFVIACALILTLCAFTAKAKPTSALYPKAMLVTELDNTNDLVICTDYNGDNWIFKGIEDWQIGDIVAAIMDSNGTETVYDDIVIDCRYNGNVN